MKKRVYLWVMLYCFPMLGVIAQQNRTLSLEEALSISYEKNSTISIAFEDLNAAIADYKTTNAIFMPQVSIAENYIYTNNPMQVFGINLQQTSITEADFAPSTLNNPNATDNWNTEFSVQMPLFNLDKIYERKAARSAMNAKSASLQRTYDHISFEVKKAYYALQLASERVDVARKSVETTASSLRVISSMKREGLVTQADLSLTKVHELKAKNQLIGAESNLRKANRYLVFLLRLDEGTQIIPSDKIGQIQEEKVQPNLMISSTRPDLMAQRHYVDALHYRVNQNKASWIPSLNAMGSYYLNSPEMFSGASSSYLVGVSLRWNLFEGGIKWNQNKKSKAQYKRAQTQLVQMEEKANMELHNTLDQIKVFEQQVKIMYEAFLQSQETYSIKYNRYSEGLEKTNDLLTYQTEMEQMQWRYLQARYQYALANFQLELILKTK
ncbi:TolC family protein [Halosquirtibacter xylanolyticus]|uniref:TolC family protein n=1 Tax=Halosquirtibacter xylanolyticus TaxID=3374599 RepID=UPI0037482A00|nr:TolC family protein [Prolixibacteraceae bacterium]